ncbi:MAG: PilZ domain-containing protein [Planctomycetota bacterium]
MPASRSRTERWRDCLHQIHSRRGAIEFTIAKRGVEQVESPEVWKRAQPDLVWRVRVLEIRGDEILVEYPAAAGQRISIEPDIDIVAAMSIGQNRWMFHSKTLGGIGTDGLGALRLAMPTTVERCMRRDFFRISTARLDLPNVDLWPLLDPQSVGPAEVANRARIEGTAGHQSLSDDSEQLMLPSVGPKFTGQLINLSGGGLGVLVARSEAGPLDASPFFWLRLDLGQGLPVPLAMTGKLVHRHTDSTQAVHAGLAFEFGFHPAHRDFIVKQVVDYVARVHGQTRAA